MTGSEIISSVKDVILAIAGAVAAVVAILGLQTWSKELKGRADFETARSLARATYRLRKELGSCRNPFVSAAEFPSGYPEFPTRANGDVEARAWRYIYGNRWKPVSDALQEFDAQALEGEALWGADVRKCADRLRACCGMVMHAMEAIIDDKAADGEHFKRDNSFGQRMRMQAAASTNASDNELNKEILASVQGIEDIVRPHLSRSPQ